MEQEDQAPAVFRAELHREYASTCAFLSYVIYDRTIGENQLENQPMLQAQNEAAGVHWGIFATDGVLFLCFRGSVTASDWITNFAVNPFDKNGYSFHSGFYAAMNNAFPSIMLVVSQHLGNRKLIVTGHSLGGALAQLFAFMYERKRLKNNINSVLECVITFAAPQACIRTPPEHNALRDKCINYACCTDPVPMLPGLVSNRNVQQIVNNMAWESSTIYGVAASTFKSQYTNILASVGQQDNLQMYRAFAHTVIVPNKVADKIFFRIPEEHIILVHSFDGNLKISSHGMLFYLGELHITELLSDVVANWFVNFNNAIRAGEQEHISEYYNSERRIMQRVQRKLNNLLRMAARPANVLRVLVPLPVVPPRLVRYTRLFSRGSEYYFLEASISEDELTSLLQLCYDQVGNDNIQLYRPEDYSWIREIKDVDLFLISVRPVSWAERQFGDIHEKEQCIRELDDDDIRNAVQALSKDKDVSPSLKMLAEEILLRLGSGDAADEKDKADVVSATPVLLTDISDPLHTHRRSICLFLCYFSYASHDEYKNEMEWEPRLVACAPPQYEFGTCEWRLYEDDTHMYLCFRGAVTKEDYVTYHAIVPALVLDGTYSVHLGYWSHMLIAYKDIVQAIQRHLRGRSLVVTGHSLGGGVAQLFALQYDYECQKNEFPPVTSVISFAALQVALISPPEHNIQLAKYVNYTCLHDPVPLFPTMLSHPNAARFIGSMSGSIMGSLLRSSMPRTLPIYHSLASTVVISPFGLNSIAPQEYRSQILEMKIDDIDKLQVKHHALLFYLGEFNQLNMLTAGVAEWYDKLDANKDNSKSFIRGIIDYIKSPFFNLK